MLCSLIHSTIINIRYDAGLGLGLMDFQSPTFAKTGGERSTVEYEYESRNWIFDSHNRFCQILFLYCHSIATE